jgi:hypothetical protein
MKIPFFKYLVLSVILIFFSEIANRIFDFRGLLYNSLSEQLTSKQIKIYLEFQDKWQWISYLMVPILVIIKTVLITSVLYIGIFISNKSTATFKELWGIVLNSEFILLFLPICKIVWFSFFQTNYKLIDTQLFYPLSALNIFDYKDLEPWLIYPLQTINIFEFAYIIYLSYQIGYLTKTNADSGLKIVASSYIPALLLWVTIVMFFTLNFS